MLKTEMMMLAYTKSPRAKKYWFPDFLYDQTVHRYKISFLLFF